MTRQECFEAVESGLLTKKDIYKNRGKALVLWQGMIAHMKQERPGVRIVIHHIDWNDQHYEDWWPVVPMYNDEHAALHHTNRIVSFEERRKISERTKGKNNPMYGKEVTPETRKKLSNACMGAKNGFYGRHHSDETKEKLRVAHLGIKATEETKAHLREAAKHRPPRSKESRAKMREIALRRGPVSAETRAKLSVACKGTHLSVEHKALLSKIVKELFWWNNGSINKRAKKCPGPDFVRGFIKKHK
jgi:hypothetical protein